MTSDNLIVAIKSIKLCSEVGNDEYINLCYFGGRRISGFEVIEGGPQRHTRSQEAKEALFE